MEGEWGWVVSVLGAGLDDGGRFRVFLWEFWGS